MISKGILAHEGGREDNQCVVKGKKPEPLAELACLFEILN